ncbi:MAG: hypothetical protein WC712_10755 [Candidatus Brocadiia bacterium]
MASATEVLAYLRGHMMRTDGSGVRYTAWYAGIATDARQRLFGEHNVSHSQGKWTYKACNSEPEARSVEKALLDLGCKGGPRGGDRLRYVYVYKITPTTKE